MRLAEGSLEAFTGDMGVDLRGCQRLMAQHFLHGTKVRPALQQMRGHRVPQAVWTQVGSFRTRPQRPMHQSPNDARIDPGAAIADEHGPARLRTGQPVAILQPGVQGQQRRATQGHDPFFAALTQDPQQLAVTIQIAQVDPTQLGDPDPTGVEHFDDREVAAGPRDAQVSLRRSHLARQGVQHQAHLFHGNCGRQSPINPGRTQPDRRILCQTTGADGPGEERARAGCAALQRRSLGVSGVLDRQPTSQRPNVHCVHVRLPHPGEVGEQAGEIAGIGPHGVGGQVPLRRKVLDVVRQEVRLLRCETGLHATGPRVGAGSAWHGTQRCPPGAAPQAAARAASYDGPAMVAVDSEAAMGIETLMTGGTVLPITRWGTPVMHSHTSPVTRFDEELHTLVRDMFATMAAARGVGLAATQVGRGIALFIYDCPDADDINRQGVVCNPVVSTPAGDARNFESEEEGCLSLPGGYQPLARPDLATCVGVDPFGEPVTIQGTGMLARCLQHETDHLNGIVFGDRLSGRVRRKLYAQHEELAHLYPEDWPVTPRRSSAS